MLNGEKIIGLCCAMANKEPSKSIIDNLAEALKKTGKYKLLVFHCFEDMYFKSRSVIGGRSIFSLINYDMIDVMIVIPGSLYDGTIIEDVAGKCRKYNIPVISFDIPVEGASLVSYDYQQAFGSIVEHILEKHGCKRIKLIAGIKDNPFSQTRVDSCRRIIKSHGLSLSDDDIYYCDFWEEPTYAAMDRYFASGEPLPDAFICCNDSMAMAVCLKLNEHGYHVPDDVIVTGFDGIEMEKYHKPRLTTAVRNDKALAEAMLEMADKLTSAPGVDPFKTVLDHEPVFSESCGCACSRNEDSNRRLTELVKGYEYSLSYEEHVNSMENCIASDPSPENVRRVLEQFCFGNTMICLTDEFYRYISGEDDHARHEEFRGFVDMHLFVCTYTDGRKADPDAVFPASRIVPQLSASFGDYNTLFIIPIHFQDTVRGYLVTHYSPDVHNNERLYTFCTSLDRCLETMLIHEHMSALNRRLEFMFTHDQLTNIYNRYGFYKGFRESYEALAGTDLDVFIVSIDLNDMKYINDTYGHSAGDDALCVTAKALTEAAASCGGGVICSRFGGDEFVAAKICLGDAKEQAELYRSGFAQALESLNASSEKPYSVNVGLGVYSASLEGVDSIDGLIDLADRLMYSDKARHKRHPRSE